MNDQLIEYLKHRHVSFSEASWLRADLLKMFSDKDIDELIQEGVLSWSLDGTVRLSILQPGTVGYLLAQIPGTLLHDHDQLAAEIEKVRAFV